MEEVTTQPNSDKLPASIRTIGWVTTILGIAPTISIIVFIVFIFSSGLLSDSNHILQLSILSKILIGISAGSVYAINASMSLFGLFLLILLDGFGITPRIFGLMLLSKSKTAWSIILVAHILLFMLYLTGLYIGFASKNRIDWMIVLLSPWPLWNLFVIWKLYEHKKLFGE